MNALDLNAATIDTVKPTLAIVSVEKLRRQCKIDHLSEDDDLKSFAETATQMIERDAQLLLRPTECQMVLDRFPCSRTPIYLQRFPATEVTEVKYIDTAGADQTWDLESYTRTFASMPQRVAPAWGETYPACREQPESVRIAFTGGYAEGEAPALAVQLVLLLVGFWYLNRELVGDVPKDFEKNYWSFVRRLSWSAP